MTGADVIDILESAINEVFCNGCAERRLVPVVLGCFHESCDEMFHMMAVVIG